MVLSEGLWMASESRRQAMSHPHFCSPLFNNHWPFDERENVRMIVEHYGWIESERLDNSYMNNLCGTWKLEGNQKERELQVWDVVNYVP